MAYCKNISVNIPVNIGDTLYCVGTYFADEITEEVVSAVIINQNGIYIKTTIGIYPSVYIGHIVFYDEDEAMKHLKDFKEV